jgi:tetratricopeptide (TPR) repeat protein
MKPDMNFEFAKIKFRYLKIACLLGASSPALSYCAEYEIGTKVFKKSKATVMIGTTIIDPKDVPFSATVGAINGEWLWLEKGWVRKSDVMSTQEALEHYTEVIRLSPSKASSWGNRGMVRIEKGDFKNAIKDLTESIRLRPNLDQTYNARGCAWDELGEFEKAIRDLSEAVRLKPDEPLYYTNRGRTFRRMGDFGKAVSDYEFAIKLSAKYSHAYMNLAWLQATCPDEHYRNGRAALENATKACEHYQWKYWKGLETIAAAYAEIGDFDNAVKWAEKTIELAPKEERQTAKEYLELYRSHKPYRQVQQKLPQ